MTFTSLGRYFFNTPTSDRKSILIILAHFNNDIWLTCPFHDREIRNYPVVRLSYQLCKLLKVDHKWTNFIKSPKKCFQCRFCFDFPSITSPSYRTTIYVRCAPTVNSRRPHTLNPTSPFFYNKHLMYSSFTGLFSSLAVSGYICHLQLVLESLIWS